MSFHLSLLFCFRRSRAHVPDTSLPSPRNDANVLQSFPPIDSPTVQAESTISSTPRQSVARGPLCPQNLLRQLFTDRAPGDFCSEPMWEPSSMPPIASVAQQHINSASHSSCTDLIEPQRLQAMQPTTDALTTTQQQRLSFELPGYLSQPQQQSIGMFNQAHHFTVMGTFIDGNVIHNNVSSDEFMEKLLRETIPGAAYDSSARDPPPRCHPGTRLAILKRCISFIRNCNSTKKMRWVVGAAGVGKSAIMQSVVESPELQENDHASVFFSINERNDGARSVVTISYQLAAKSQRYRQIIEREITRDPSLLQSSMVRQFNKLIIEPFMQDPQLNSAGPVLIVIDGLDECNNPRTQQDLLRLITNCCITYPASPLVWLVASRPEPHITSFFSRAEVIPAYEKEEIRVDSDEARSDVERFLRHELNEIKTGSDSLDHDWPEERDIWKLASAAGGLFAYAQTVSRYIGDWRIGNPVSQLSDVLQIIDHHPLTEVSKEQHPMASLDALYDRILSNVPSKIMVKTRKLLLALVSGWDLPIRYMRTGHGNFIILCNWLGMTPDEAYAALNHLHSVLYVPHRDEAMKAKLMPLHKSFIDYVSDFTRSGFSRDVHWEAQQLMSQCAFRVLKEAPGGIDRCDLHRDREFRYGELSLGSHTRSQISLTWSVEAENGWSDVRTRLRIYQLAVGEVIGQMERGDLIFSSEFCVRLLTARVSKFQLNFPYDKLRDWVFNEPRRSYFITCGVLRQIPLGVLDISDIEQYRQSKLRFRGPATTVANPSDPWCSSCQHERTGEWAEGNFQDWVTTFSSSSCTSCCNRLMHQLESWKTRSPNHNALILFTSSFEHCIEVRYVDIRDGVSEWIYRFWFGLEH